MIKYDFDIIIIGGGPAGMAAALYAVRGGLKVAFIEKGAPGGKMITTFNISNWIGTEEIHGAQLSLNMLNHVKNVGAVHKYGNVVGINNISETTKEIILENGQKLRSYAVIIATGMKSRIPEEIEGIHEYENNGVSYCVVCDGPLYGHSVQSIIGGGDSAIEESTYLANIAKEVNIFIREDKPKAEKVLLEKLKEKPNINIYLKSQVKKIIGTKEKGIEKLLVEIDGVKKEFESSALFPYIGFIPITDFAKEFDIFDKTGFIIVDKNMETSVKGIFAIGDIIVKDIRQVATAVNDGVIAGKYLATNLVRK